MENEPNASHIQSERLAMSDRTTEERVSDDRLQELIDVYDGQAFRGDFVLALQELQRLRHYVATCGGTDNDGRCPMHHLAGVSPEPRGKEPPHCPSCNCGEHILGEPAALQKAATDLYMAGRWTLHGMPGIEQAVLWEALRDAIPLPPGTATSLSLTKAEVRPPFCGYCGDAGTVPNNSPGAPDLPCPRCSLNGGAGK